MGQKMIVGFKCTRLAINRILLAINHTLLALISLSLQGCLEVVIPHTEDSLIETSLDLSLSGQSPSTPTPDSSNTPSNFPSTPPSDAFVQSMPPLNDWSPADSAQSFGLCVANMKQTLLEIKQQNCSMYTEQERQNRSSDYHRKFVVSACLYLACDQRIIEGHNGVMISKSCAELDDLYAVLERAEVQALNGECNVPTYQTAWLPLEQFQGGEACDQIQCSFGPDTQVGF